MKAAKILLTAGMVAGFLLATGCGFRPIYATSANGVPPLTQRIVVRDVAAPDTIRPLIEGALDERILLKAGQRPRYDLYISVKESAERLAVQIDATVTRYNYRLRASYTVVDLLSGRRSRGRVQSVTSYNIVSSQYSTLYAERTAQEKASRLLVEEIERDLLIKFTRIAPKRDTQDAEEDVDDAVESEPEDIELIEELWPAPPDDDVIRIDDGTN